MNNMRLVHRRTYTTCGSDPFTLSSNVNHCVYIQISYGQEPRLSVTYSLCWRWKRCWSKSSFAISLTVSIFDTWASADVDATGLPSTIIYISWLCVIHWFHVSFMPSRRCLIIALRSSELKSVYSVGFSLAAGSSMHTHNSVFGTHDSRAFRGYQYISSAGITCRDCSELFSKSSHRRLSSSGSNLHWYAFSFCPSSPSLNLVFTIVFPKTLQPHSTRVSVCVVMAISCTGNELISLDIPGCWCTNRHIMTTISTNNNYPQFKHGTIFLINPKPHHPPQAVLFRPEGWF